MELFVVKKQAMNDSKFLNWLIRPEVLLIIMAAFFATKGLVYSNEAIDAHLHDTYYIIAWPLWAFPGPLVLLLFALIYWLTRNLRQWKALQYFHVLSFLVAPFLISLLTTDNNIPVSGSIPDDYFERYNNVQRWGTVLLVILLLGQIAFLINLIAGFIRGKKSPEEAQ
ncbi:hypothetical protein [Chitinophaga deserti]|uniref:hypothetical protein n=1 Tax=Chitinophaga deserti TaxID=2164099 RepID=UPI000D6CB105|nr:hypothetical protein [Chitinophaga deserti]